MKILRRRVGGFGAVTLSTVEFVVGDTEIIAAHGVFPGSQGKLSCVVDAIT